MQQINASCNGELLEGATDGKVKKVRPNTRVGDFGGHLQIVQNKRALTVPGNPLNVYGAIPLDSDSWVGKVRPA